MGVGGQRHDPAALPPGMTRYPLYRRLGRPQGRSGRVRKISPPSGFDPRTVQPAASRYTTLSRPTCLIKYGNKFSSLCATLTNRVFELERVFSEGQNLLREYIEQRFSVDVH